MRLLDLGCEPSVFPLQVDAHALLFATKFFNAVVAIASFRRLGSTR